MAYALPAAAIWALIGLAVTTVRLPHAAVIVATGYALVFGAAEATWSSLRAPSSSWGVPSAWVRERAYAARTLVWGMCLGPGLATKNPYGGIWLVPLMLASITTPADGLLRGAAVGTAHGVMRAVGVRANARSSTSFQAIMLRMLYWRFADGVVLLLIGGLLLGGLS